MNEKFPEVASALLPTIVDLHTRLPRNMSIDTTIGYKEIHGWELDEMISPQNWDRSTTIRWDNTAHLTEEIIEKLKEKGYMPTKGIAKNIFATGPWEPEIFKSLGKGYAPAETKYLFHDYDKMEESVIRISGKLEEVGIPGVLETFRLFRARSFRKDLWTKLIMWENGGITMDAKFSFQTEIDWIDWENDE